MENSNLTRLNKFLSEVGYCSRREADKLIDQGRVTINNKVPEMGTKVAPGDEIRVDGELIHKPKEKHVYLAFHKPVGIVCTTAQHEKDNIIDFINYPKRIFPIGRLDKPSEGLILLTSDGDIVNKILRARNNHEKEYIVTVNKLISPQFIKRMGNGIPILDTITRKCEVEQINKYDFRIVLTQGLNRQIRRMCEHLGYEVIRLKRIRIMNVNLDTPLGEWRYLTEKELQVLNNDIGDSSKTEEASVIEDERSVRNRNTSKRFNPKNNNRKASANNNSSTSKKRKRSDRKR
ncbi:23S rRNA pseudouridine(2604) synthase RluF [Aquimarina sp. 2201CG14-23]|uniref:23S rRNA pseudouridine(2604) synthase RluF n=1 Tax=Aquimarina mycalae TaxID=3040073 RepID=UPI002477E94A|nr:23S rRNA pseudouridine(2604) synthase RluF [Aquimarina sp. 2201CG14-23]MDH7445018.1 23S rRNA pseudouridine(2604) synthase RluF [Aquimarina sp. 2201CG14-23]